MAMNNGKIFETQFKKSIPTTCFYYRFKDSPANYSHDNSSIRFTTSNIADNLVFNGSHLFINELKSHKGKSLPLNCIRRSQINGMLDACIYQGITCYLFIYFSDIQECYALNFIDFYDFVTKYSDGRKSIPLDFFRFHAKNIPIKFKRTLPYFDLNSIFDV